MMFDAALFYYNGVVISSFWLGVLRSIILIFGEEDVYCFNLADFIFGDLVRGDLEGERLTGDSFAGLMC